MLFEVQKAQSKGNESFGNTLQLVSLWCHNIYMALEDEKLMFSWKNV